MKNQYHVSIRQEYYPNPYDCYRLTIDRESMTVTEECANKIYSRVKAWDVEINRGIITLSGILEVNR